MMANCSYRGCQKLGEYDVTRFDEEWRGAPLYCKPHAIIICQEEHKKGGRTPSPVHGKTDYYYRKAVS